MYYLDVSTEAPTPAVVTIKNLNELIQEISNNIENPKLLVLGDFSFPGANWEASTETMHSLSKQMHSWLMLIRITQHKLSLNQPGSHLDKNHH